MKYFMVGATFAALLLFTIPAFAAHPDPGFWPGYLDGFLSLPRLIVSPVVDVTIVREHLGPLGYTAGYCLGLLSFAAAAGALAAVETGQEEIRWG